MTVVRPQSHPQYEAVSFSLDISIRALVRRVHIVNTAAYKRTPISGSYNNWYSHEPGNWSLFAYRVIFNLVSLMVARINMHTREARETVASPATSFAPLKSYMSVQGKDGDLFRLDSINIQRKKLHVLSWKISFFRCTSWWWSDKQYANNLNLIFRDIVYRYC